MKKLFTPPLMTMLFCCIGAFFITSCDDDDEKGPVNIAHPFQSVTAVDGSTTATAVISDDDKTITFPEFQELTDLSNVEVTFNLTPGAFLKTPAKPTARVNLTTAYTVEVNTGGYLPVAYTMTAKPKDIPNPILSAKVGDVEATMEGNIISIAYAAGMDINAMVFDFTLVAGASIKSPANKTFDLELADGTLVITYGGVDYTFVVRATGYTDPLLSNGWTDETAKFGSLPKYIKVYKNEDLLNKPENKSLGYIAIMGPQATMGVVGSGKTGAKPITELEQEGNWNVILVGVSTSATQTIVRDGKFVQDPEGLNSFATIGQDKNGICKMAWTQKFDGKLYSFPFRNASSFTPRVQGDGTVWDVQTAVSGVPMILWDGNVLTAEQTIGNDGTNMGWYGGVAARAAVGVTAHGKVIAFCGQQVEGSVGVTMLEMAKIMKDVGCVSAMTFEGSSSPNMHVNKQATVVNSNLANGKPEKNMQCGLVFK